MTTGIVRGSKVIVTDEDGNEIEIPYDETKRGMTFGWPPNASIERELGPQRRELPRATIAAFLEELTALSKKFGILIEGEYDTPVLLGMLPSEEAGAYALPQSPFRKDDELCWVVGEEE